MRPMLILNIEDHQRALHGVTLVLALLVLLATLPWAWEAATPRASSWQMLTFIVACMIALWVWLVLLSWLSSWASHARMTITADGLRSRFLGFLPLGDIERVRLWWQSGHGTVSAMAHDGAIQRLRLETTRGTFDYTVHPPCDVAALKMALSTPRLLWQQAPRELQAPCARVIVATQAGWKPLVVLCFAILGTLCVGMVLGQELEDEALDWHVAGTVIASMLLGAAALWWSTRDEVTFVDDTGFRSRRFGLVGWADVAAVRLSDGGSQQMLQEELLLTLKDGRTIGFVYYFSGRQFGHLVEACRRQKLL